MRAAACAGPSTVSPAAIATDAVEAGAGTLLWLDAFLQRLATHGRTRHELLLALVFEVASPADAFSKAACKFTGVQLPMHVTHQEAFRGLERPRQSYQFIQGRAIRVCQTKSLLVIQRLFGVTR